MEVKEFNYMKYYDSGKYGVIDREGNILIDAQYNSIIIPNPEKAIFICYSSEDNQKVLNSDGKELFTKYDKIEPIKLKNVASVLCYEKSVLCYEKDGLYGIVNFDGKELTKNIYNSIENLQSTEGKFLVSKDNKYGIVNINGKELVKTNYDSITTDGYYTENDKYLKAGFIISNTTDEGYRYGYVDYKGKLILDVQYNEITRITDLEDLYLIAANNGKYGLYKNSKNIIPTDYQLISYDDVGLVVLQKNKKYGMADLKGNIKINIEYTNIESKGIYVYASNENKNAVFDKDGNQKDINFNKNVYETENENYRITTLVNNNVIYYGIEDKNETSLVNEGYSYLEYAYNDYFIAKNSEGKLGVINANGKVLIDFKYNLIQKIKGKNMIQVLDDKTTYIYSNNLEVICKIKKANIDNEDNFIKLYNDKEEIYLNNDGQKISKEDDLVKKAELNKQPDNIGDYNKEQYSLENVYYVKK